jgi:hypothetical protein
MTREEWEAWREKVNTAPAGQASPTPHPAPPMYDPVPPSSVREVQGGAPGLASGTASGAADGGRLYV